MRHYLRHRIRTIRALSEVALLAFTLTLNADAAQLSLGAWQEFGLMDTETAAAGTPASFPRAQRWRPSVPAQGVTHIASWSSVSRGWLSQIGSIHGKAGLAALSTYVAPFCFGAASLPCVWARCSPSQASASDADRKA